MSDEESELDELAPWLALVITLGGGFLRVLLLSFKGMGLDETLSVFLASHSVADMLQWIVKLDQQPPLYYLLLHAWTSFNGFAPPEVRMLSALFGTATIPIVYLIGKRLSGTVVGLAAALLLAVSPFNIRLSQDTTMYSVLAFNAAVAIYALVRLLTDARSARPIGSQFRQYLREWWKPGPVEPDPKAVFSYKDQIRQETGWRAWIFNHRWSPIETVETDLAWVAFIVFSAATLLTHNTAVLFPLATNIFVLGLMLIRRKAVSSAAFQAPSLLNWVVAQAGIFLLWSPWLSAFIQQAGRAGPESWIAKPSWAGVTQALRTFLNENTLPPISQAWMIWVLFAAVLGLGLVYYRKAISRLSFLAVLFAIPFLGELVASIRQPVFLDRTLVWATIPLFLLVGAGIAQLRSRILMIVVVGTLATINMFSAGDYFRWLQKEDWSTPAGFVAKFAEKDDLVLFSSAWAQIPFDYYFKPYEEFYSIQVEKQGVPADLFNSGIVDATMQDSDLPTLASLLRGHNRVWLVYSNNAQADPQGLIAQTLASQMKLVVTRDFTGGQLQFYAGP